MSNDTQVIPSEINTSSPIKSKIYKIIELLKPNIFSIGLMLTTFIIVIVTTKHIAISTTCAVIAYLGLSFIIQPLLKDKIKLQWSKFDFLNPNKKTISVPTNNSSILFSQKGNKLIAISLLRLEWYSESISLKPFWDFLMDEGIIIHDCREGCFLIIRRNTIVKKDQLVEQLKKMKKEIEKTILLTKRKFNIENERISLFLVKERSDLLDIFHLGQSTDNFHIVDYDMTDEDIDYMRIGSNLSNETHEDEIEELMQR